MAMRDEPLTAEQGLQVMVALRNLHALDFEETYFKSLGSIPASSKSVQRLKGIVLEKTNLQTFVNETLASHADELLACWALRRGAKYPPH